MDYFLTNIKVISALFLLMILPGMLFMSLLRARERIANIDSYEIISLSLMSGLTFWILISLISYSLNVNVNSPIYMSVFVTGFLALCVLFKNNFKLNGLVNLKSKNHLYGFFNVYAVIIVIESILVGYVSQYQTGNSDAFAHLAGIRNLATFGTIQNCDWVLGTGAPMVNAYGCHPWYLTAGMIVNLSNVDAALAYATLSGALYFLSVLSIYSLIKVISGDVFIAKIGSIIFSLASVMNWFLAIGDAPYYSLDPINNLIFPSHFDSYILFPITLALFIRYLLCGEKFFLISTLVSFLVTARFHPTWLIWAPILLSGIIIFRNLFGKKFKIKNYLNYKIILLFGFVSFLSALGYLLCGNTFPSDPNIMSPLALWRSSGGNLLYISEYIYLYDPLVYLKDRGIYDVTTIALLWYLSKNINGKQLDSSFPGNGVPYNELLTIYLGALAIIALVIFNPFVVYITITVTKAAVVLYRTFGLMMPVLSCFTISAALIFLKLKFGVRKFPLIAIAATISGALLISISHSDYLKKLYKNYGNYYSTNKSLYLEPFSTLRTLGHGKVAVRTPLATAIAALTDLDPITTEVWRSKSTIDIAVDGRENNALLAFDKSQDELLSILKNRHIRYIIISRADTSSVVNFNKHPELVHFKVPAGADEVWEVNEKL